jgi:hypothetical protein
MFTGMGAEAFAARAERELLATGERVRKRRIETRDTCAKSSARSTSLRATNSEVLHDSMTAGQAA